MSKVIRNSSQTDEDIAAPKPLRDIWLWLLGAIALAATIAAAWHGQKLGWQASLLLIGVSVVSMLAIMSLMYARTAAAQEQGGASDKAEILGASFQKITTPSVITMNSAPLVANKAYIDLCAGLGMKISADLPPSIDSLFATAGESGTAALFRLHHTKTGQAPATETITTYDDDGAAFSISVSVTALASGQLWQLLPLKEGNEGTSLLTGAPIGLFTMGEGGEILQMNAVLRGWIGLEAGDEIKHIKNFIENSDALLGGDKSVGRIVRSDTRLITQKDVVSPTVMMGAWHAMDTGALYASVALYGHSGLGQAPAKGRTASGASVDGDILGSAPFSAAQINSADLSRCAISAVNDALEAISQRTDLVGASFMSLFVDDAQTRKAVRAGIDPSSGPVNLYLATKPPCPVDVYFTAPGENGCAVYIVDVSGRHDLEDQLFQSQKMQAIGLLAGGVAHDFNNLLTAIRLNTDELLGRHPVGDPSYPELQQINQTVTRSAGLVRKLLAFSRKQTLRSEILNVTETLSDLSVMLKQVMSERVQLDVLHGRGLPDIYVDKTQLESVLMNLCVNARDAMVEKGGGGRITLRSIKTSPEDFEHDDIEPDPDQEFVIIEVTDTGTGMDAATQKKIFEPFFTTKEQGKGTGLGLATVYGIVQQSGGHLRVTSKLGAGTTFRVYFPTASQDVLDAQPATPIKKQTPKPADLAGQGKILFVEDEHAVRKIAAKTLRKRGYTVIEAEDGEEAYEILEEGETKFDLMISDVVMPGMDGPTLLKKGRSLLGDARIVFISGYAEEEFSELLAEEPDVTFLPKPFTLAQLASKVKEVIGEAG